MKKLLLIITISAIFMFASISFDLLLKFMYGVEPTTSKKVSLLLMMVYFWIPVFIAAVIEEYRKKVK